MKIDLASWIDAITIILCTKKFEGTNIYFIAKIGEKKHQLECHLNDINNNKCVFFFFDEISC